MGRRHIVSVEDHLYHTSELLDVMARAAPELLSWITVFAIEAAGPDTTRTVADWLGRHPGLQVAACVGRDDVAPEHAARLMSIEPGHLEDLSGFARTVASLLLPGGVLVQDIHLSTLSFVSKERWWESIYAAAMVRGLFAGRPPAVRFLSNKRGYAATFGRDLMGAGFDPRDVMDKAELETMVVPAIVRDLAERFPLGLELAGPGARSLSPVANDDVSRGEIEGAIDLVEWHVGGRVQLGGRALSAPVAFRAGSQEAVTWQSLIADRFSAGPGVPVIAIGMRLADSGAERAEASNLAARHMHALRARLSNPGAIVTANHAYRLDERLSIGRVRAR
jgi:hypothetical protein